MSILSSYIRKQVKKYGFASFLMKVGDIAVKLTRSSADDVLWGKIRKVLKTGKVADLLEKK